MWMRTPSVIQSGASAVALMPMRSAEISQRKMRYGTLNSGSAASLKDLKLIILNFLDRALLCLKIYQHGVC